MVVEVSLAATQRNHFEMHLSEAVRAVETQMIGEINGQDSTNRKGFDGELARPPTETNRR